MKILLFEKIKEEREKIKQKQRRNAIKMAILCLAVFAIVFSLCGCEAENPNSYDIKVVLADDMTLDVVQTVIYQNEGENKVQSVCFNLYQNTTREGAEYIAVTKDMLSSAYPNGESFGGIEFSHIKVNGEVADFSVCGEDQNFLEVSVVGGLLPGESVQIEMTYKVTLANINSRLGYGEDTINLGNFYPILAVFEQDDNGEWGYFECVPYSLGDPFYSGTATYSVQITCDDKYVIASSGKEVSSKSENGTTTAVFEAEEIRSFAMVLSENFSVQTQIKNGVEINYYYLSDTAPTLTTAMIATALEYFEDSYGDYNYKTLSVVDTNFFQGGMEYSSLVMISSIQSGADKNYVVVHELAHQWWQTAVGTNEVENSVLDEGLCEYSVISFFSEFPDYGVSAETLTSQKQEIYSNYLQILQLLEEKTPPTLSRSLQSYRSSLDYYALSYVQGCLVLLELEEEVGKEEMTAMLSDFYSKFNGENATLEDFLDCICDNLGEEKYLYMQNLYFT